MANWSHESRESESGTTGRRPRHPRTSVFGHFRRSEEAQTPARIFDRFTQRGDGPASTSTNSELKVSRALEVFNCGGEIQTVAAVARSLGTPTVTADPVSKSSIVTITVAWELSWYRYEVDLADESSGARLADRGYDQSELDGRDQRDNVRTDDRGRLHLSRPRTA